MDSKIELKYAVEHFCDIIINRADLYFMNLLKNNEAKRCEANYE